MTSHKCQPIKNGTTKVLLLILFKFKNFLSDDDKIPMYHYNFYYSAFSRRTSPWNLHLFVVVEPL